MLIPTLGRSRLGPLSFLIVALAGLGLLPAARSQSPPQSPPQATPYDQPLTWLREGKEFHRTRVRDYTCTMVKQERIRGRLQEENVILMKFRNVPFSVYMKWLAPKSLSRQEVCFVWGRHNNKLRVHAPGLVSVAGWVSIDPHDRKVMDQSRHAIYEAGVGKLLDRYIEEFEKGKELTKSRVTTAEYDFQGRRCYRIEAVHSERVPGAYAYRSVLYLDKEWRLPVRTESYDWPRADGPPEGQLLEVYSFVDFRFNLGLTENDFRY